ncbi:MAG: ABC transporter ATP-binding protein [Eubacteriales bacterium]|nr:ABC transporter ATP-binding protein [Eubacteriales bacterium]
MKKNKDKSAGIYLWVLKKIHELSPHCIPLHLIKLLLSLAVTYLPIIGMRYLLASALEQEWQRLLTLGLGLYMTLGALNALLKYIAYKLNLIGYRMNRELIAEMTLHSLEIDYETMTSGKQKEGFRRALENMSFEMGNFNTFISRVMGITENLLSIVLASAISYYLITSVVTKPVADPFIAWLVTPFASFMIALGSVVLGLVIQTFLSKSASESQRKYFEDHAKVEAVLSYYLIELANSTSKYGLFQNYNMLPLLSARLNHYNLEALKFFSKQGHAQRMITTSTAIFSGIVLVAAYALAGVKALYGAIPLASLITYAQAFVQLNSSLAQLMERRVHLKASKLYFTDIRDYVTLENKLATGTLPVEKRRDHKLTLELENVSFHYPGSDEMVLKEINLTLDMNRRHALVGPNGAGKSTLIYLICRLYDPTAGRILLNGVDIRKYDYEEYLSLFSVVFQDFQLFALPLAENVACQAEYEDDKIIRTLERAGFDKEALAGKSLSKQVVEYEGGGKSFSGGEQQKIAIARALYKDASFVILDEPTAALDPKSEAEIYERLQELIENKTTIFISHRMSSCRLCEDIIVLDQGEIVEQGSHAELLAKEGLYQEMWQAQAQYYA